MDFRFLTLREYNSIVKKAMENHVDYDDISDESMDLLLKVLKAIQGEIHSRYEFYSKFIQDRSTPVETLNLKKDASTEVDLALFPSFSPSQAPLPGSAETEDSIPMYFLLVSLFTGSAYLIYLVGSCFLVPVPQIEDIIAAVNFFSSPVVPPVIPEVIIPEPSSTIVDYLPSYTTVIITTAVVVTL